MSMAWVAVCKNGCECALLNKYDFSKMEEIQ